MSAGGESASSSGVALVLYVLGLQIIPLVVFLFVSHLLCEYFSRPTAAYYAALGITVALSLLTIQNFRDEHLNKIFTPITTAAILVR